MSSKKNVFLVISDSFGVRAFLMTRFLSILSKKHNVGIINPYSDDPIFRKKFGKDNVSFFKMEKIEKFKGNHKKWFQLRSDIMNLVWNYNSTTIENKLLIHSGYDTVLSTTFSIKNFIYDVTIFLGKYFYLVRKLILYIERRSFWKDYKFKNYAMMFNQFKPHLILSTKSGMKSEYPISQYGIKYSIPQITYVLSFDNLITSGVFPINYDKWLVWNGINKNQVLSQYKEINKDQVVVCGPLQFDFYKQKDNHLVTKEIFFNKQNLDIEKSLIVLGAGPDFIGFQEPFAIMQIAKAIRDGKIIKDTQILVRLHPDDDIERWNEVVKMYPEILFSSPLNSKTSVKIGAFSSKSDISLLLNTLCHSDILINTSSSMALDAVFYDKPVICLAYDDNNEKGSNSLCKSLYEREHYLPIVESNGTCIANSLEETINAINNYLINPIKDSKKRLDMLKIFDPFLDGKASQRVADSVLNFIEEI